VHCTIFEGRTALKALARRLSRNSSNEPRRFSLQPVRVTQNRFQPNREESQMHSSLTAAVLCIFVHAASAQCAPAAPVVHDAAAAVDTTRTPGATAPAAATPRPGGVLIKAAAAGTRDAPVMRETAQRAPAGEDHPRRGGTAMLLAALALMSGIALRRFGAPGQ
jgi:hypothetical protein